MSDRFTPLTLDQLVAWTFDELAMSDSVFGLPREGFFVPRAEDPFRLVKYGQPLDTPFGVAAGPHSQLAQNLVAAFLEGARFMELKTVQTLDELEISKPCIDMEDEGYNCEWSQELKVQESFDEYLRAWVIIHALHHLLGFPGERPGTIFNVSVGYDLAGIRKPNVQWFLEQVRGAPDALAEVVEAVARKVPAVRDLPIPAAMSDNVTLSTMHGCPPDEIESIARYLIEQGFHTSVKLNPTLLGPERVRGILTERLGYEDVVVPDAAFEHDLKWADAVPMLRRLSAEADARGVTFGVKLSNTLEVENHRRRFEGEQMMYLSGRPLHALTVNLAAALERELPGRLLMSFAGGADAFNAPSLLAAGMKTVTVCSDLLKTGGYGRLPQYLERTREAMAAVGATDLEDFAVRTALAEDGEGLLGRLSGELPEHLRVEAAADLVGALETGELPAFAAVRGYDADALRAETVEICARANLERTAEGTVADPLLEKGRFVTWKSKTERTLGAFDCVKAPCTDACAVDQEVPQYMRAVREGRMDDAVAVVRRENPIPTILSRICDRKCQDTCIRTHLDEPVAIREIKRFVMDHEAERPAPTPAAKKPVRVALVGAGPCGAAAAEALAEAGYACTIFEQHRKAGGMVSGTIPVYRLPQASIDQDLSHLEALGVEVRYGMKAGRDFTLSGLRDEGFDHVVLAVGAQAGKRLGLEGEDAAGVIDAIEFLRRVRDGETVDLGRRVGIVGAGDVAMDAARTAYRLSDGQVTLIYRRTVSQMPADPEEIEGLLEEGIEVAELHAPSRLEVEGGRLKALVCTPMKLGPKGADGRRRPVPSGAPERVFPLDTLLLAVSQAPVLDFFDETAPRLTDWGAIEADPETLETSVPGVFAGGDAAQDGPASAVRAAGDGKRIARAIRAKVEGAPAPERRVLEAADLRALTVRRARREMRAPLPHRPADDRRHFQEVMHTLTPEAARAEAERCVDCDTVCSLCVSVCPNRAFQTYVTRPFEAVLPRLTFEGGGWKETGAETFRVDQAPQVAVVADFCNECGNCETFCPTSGTPYRDKPRLYLDLAEFEAQADNAFMLLRDGERRTLRGRFGGETHVLVRDAGLTYRAPGLTVRLDPERLEVLEVEATGEAADGATVSLAPAGTLHAILEGLRTSLPFLPGAILPEGSGVEAA